MSPEADPHGAENVVAALRAGDPAGLRHAYERHRNDVLAVAAAVLGPLAADAAWDVLHDVFVGLARNSASLAADTNLRAYLTRAAVNRARDRVAKANVAGVRAEEVGAGTEDVDVVSLLERAEEAAELWRGVAALPEEQRTVVSLRVFGDLSFREIAEQERISENTAQSRWRYAIGKLRRHFSVTAGGDDEVQR